MNGKMEYDGYKEMCERLKRTIDARNAELATLRAELDRALNAVVKIGSRYQRDCLGLNNEGDPIGGDPPIGWKPRAMWAESQLSELMRLVSQDLLDNHPKAYRIRLLSSDAEEWTILSVTDAIDFLYRKEFECQPLYAHATRRNK